MNKKNLCFISLVSIILILCIYYVSIPSSILENVEPTISNSYESVEIEDTSNIIGLKVEKEEATLSQIEELQNKMFEMQTKNLKNNFDYQNLKSEYPSKNILDNIDINQIKIGFDWLCENMKPLK